MLNATQYWMVIKALISYLNLGLMNMVMVNHDTEFVILRVSYIKQIKIIKC